MGKKTMFTLEEVQDMISEGKLLILAGDERVLDQLPQGDWIAGTIPYFMGDDGGEFSQDKIYVTELPDYLSSAQFKLYDNNNIDKVYEELPNSGFGLIIIPAATSIHQSFSLSAHDYKDFAAKPLIGWISGVYLEDLDKVTPKVYYGPQKKKLENAAVVLSARLPENKIATVGMVNMFKQGEGDNIMFESDGFVQKEAIINNEKVNFADYLTKNNVDIKLPLVTDSFGTMINVSFQKIDEENKSVSLYAPVFRGVVYKVAEPVQDYMTSFKSKVLVDFSEDILFSCNCILNYLYSELEGEKTGTITGPVTFGEIAYQLINQTLAYITVKDL